MEFKRKAKMYYLGVKDCLADWMFIGVLITIAVIGYGFILIRHILGKDK